MSPFPNPLDEGVFCRGQSPRNSLNETTREALTSVWGHRVVPRVDRDYRFGFRVSPGYAYPMDSLKHEISCRANESSWLKWLIWVVFALFVVYPLSTGPVCWLYFEVVQPDQSSQFCETILATVYWPLSAVIVSSQPLEDFFWWYVFDLWEVDVRALDCYNPHGQLHLILRPS